MKTSTVLFTVLTALSLSACSAKVGSSDPIPETPVTRKSTPETQTLKVGTGISTGYANSITLYGPLEEKDMYFNYTATADGYLAFNSASKLGYACPTSQIIDTIDWQTLRADGTIGATTQLSYAYSTVSILKNISYRLKLNLKGLKNCDTLYYDFYVDYTSY